MEHLSENKKLIPDEKKTPQFHSEAKPSKN